MNILMGIGFHETPGTRVISQWNLKED